MTWPRPPQEPVHRESSAGLDPAGAVIRDPALRLHRRYFVVADSRPVRRAFTATGAARIASRTSTTPWWSTLKRKWNEHVEREESYRRTVGYP